MRFTTVWVANISDQFRPEFKLLDRLDLPLSAN